jgi:uncharacterized repeat protein (TIGR01451 family)
VSIKGSGRAGTLPPATACTARDEIGGSTDPRPAGRHHRRPRVTLVRRVLGLASAAALLGILMVPGTVAAASFTITAPFPGVAVAPGSTASFDLTVTSAQTERVDLSVDGVPSGWSAVMRGGGLIVDAVTAKSDGSETVRLDVTVPADATARTYSMTVVGTSGSNRSTLPISVTVSKAAAGDVTMTTDFPSLTGSSTTTFTFNLTLKNGTTQDLTFGVNAQGPTGWTISARPSSQSQASTFQVNAGSSAGITVTANAPTDVEAGTYPIAVTATSSAGTVGGQLSVEITGQYGMTLTTPDGRLNASGQAGSVIERQLVIENTGTAPLTNVSMTDTLPSGWKVTYDPADPIASIAANSSATVTANITPASNALAGDYVATFHATAKDSSTNASADIRVTVETSLTWLIVGIGIIVLAVLGLGWVFQRYGRR